MGEPTTCKPSNCLDHSTLVVFLFLVARPLPIALEPELPARALAVRAMAALVEPALPASEAAEVLLVRQPRPTVEHHFQHPIQMLPFHLRRRASTTTHNVVTVFVGDLQVKCLVIAAARTREEIKYMAIHPDSLYDR